MPVGAPDVELDVEDERKRPMTYRSRRPGDQYLVSRGHVVPLSLIFYGYLAQW